jgi:hypothetical protein
MSYTYSRAKLFAAADLTLMRSNSNTKVRLLTVQSWTLTTAQVGQFGHNFVIKWPKQGVKVNND